MAKRKGKKTESNTAKPDWINDVLINWASAADKNHFDVFGTDDAPEWVLNAWVETCKIVFPGGLPAPEKWDANFVGVLLGRYYGLANLYEGNVPLGPETEAELARLTENINRQPLPKGYKGKIKAVLKDYETISEATRKAIPLATSAAVESSYPEALAFQNGLKRGTEIKPDDLATSRTFERHTRTYYVLALFWRFWMTCKSLREVHRHLCNAMGEQKIGSFKTFEKLCKKIKFKLRGRGRPPGKK